MITNLKLHVCSIFGTVCAIRKVYCYCTINNATEIEYQGSGFLLCLMYDEYIVAHQLKAGLSLKLQVARYLQLVGGEMNSQGAKEFLWSHHSFVSYENSQGSCSYFIT